MLALEEPVLNWRCDVQSRQLASKLFTLALLGAALLSPGPHQATATGGGALAIAAGTGHTCAVTAGGRVLCWGRNDFGQLGIGVTGGSESLPVAVPGLVGVVAVSMGEAHTCALGGDGGLSCWGDNFAGQLGNGASGGMQDEPVEVVGLAGDVVAVAAGFEHTCALTAAGGVQCWGSNFFGQLGTGGVSSETPVDVTGLTSGVTAIASGGYHMCAFPTDDGVLCWGRNDHGQLGDGTDAETRPEPVRVVGLTAGVTAIAAGSLHTCARTTVGGVKCWGRNTAGQLGDGTFNSSSTVVDVEGLASGVTEIDMGGFHSCAVSVDALLCWGRNGDGQLGIGEPSGAQLTPAAVVGLESNAGLVGVGHAHTCSVSDVGSVTCWGDNASGQLGDGTTADRGVPGAVSGLDTKLLSGDADCSGSVDAVDAALVLQFDAALFAALPCPENGDVDADGRATSIDAALILQFDAGLIEVLP